LVFISGCSSETSNTKRNIEKLGYEFSIEGFYKSMEDGNIDAIKTFEWYYVRDENTDYDAMYMDVVDHIIKVGKTEVIPEMYYQSWVSKGNGAPLVKAIDAGDEKLIKFYMDIMNSIFKEEVEKVRMTSERYLLGKYPNCLASAVKSGNQSLVKRMMKEDVFLKHRKTILRQDLKNHDRNYALNYYAAGINMAAWTGNQEMLQLVLNLGADSYRHLRNVWGYDEDDPRLERLNKNIPPRTIVGQNGNTPIFLATTNDFSNYYEKEAMVRFLIENDFYINIPNDVGRTPLINATLVALYDKSPPANNTRIIRLLLKHGADATKVDESGKAALDYALEMKDSPSAARIVSLLKEVS